MTKPTKAFAVPALLAALSLSATPAAAAQLPTQSSATVAHAASNYGWGWGSGHRYRHRGRTSAGDVLAGVLILGTIAAVASAASKAERNRGYPYRTPYPYPDRRGDYRPDNPRGIEGAADLCLREIERDVRVEEVTRVERDASGWRVTGQTVDGADFTCSIGADGRIDRIEIGGRAQVLGDGERRSEDDDDRYRSADAQPDYPGGPLPGEADEDGAMESDPSS